MLYGSILSTPLMSSVLANRRNTGDEERVSYAGSGPKFSFGC
jgi:hypothetical protein